jgi:hypothetical protein
MGRVCKKEAVYVAIGHADSSVVCHCIENLSWDKTCLIFIIQVFAYTASLQNAVPNYLNQSPAQTPMRNPKALRSAHSPSPPFSHPTPAVSNT